jgi:hypothetical protein
VGGLEGSKNVDEDDIPRGPHDGMKQLKLK